jgi:hypothetical protein
MVLTFSSLAMTTWREPSLLRGCSRDTASMEWGRTGHPQSQEYLNLVRNWVLADPCASEYCGKFDMRLWGHFSEQKVLGCCRISKWSPEKTKYGDNWCLSTQPLVI